MNTLWEATGVNNTADKFFVTHTKQIRGLYISVFMMVPSAHVYIQICSK